MNIIISHYKMNNEKNKKNFARWALICNQYLTRLDIID